MLIVGGTESGCAAAIQAARMGVKRITLVNDIDWLGGQFSAEALVAIDENRGPSGYGYGVPFPRSGLFKEVIDRIEEMNQSEYGRYEVTFCIGDSGHEQPGQHVVIEDVVTAQKIDTAAGRFYVGAISVEVRDGRLTVVIGSRGDKVNTCLNWLVIRSVK